MRLTEPEVRYVADLANLRLSEEEVSRMSHDLGEILTHIEQLNELDTSNVEPMAQVLYEADETATLREDIPHTPLGNREALANAAASGAGYFKVPRVIDR
ncbi:MAG: Asp-tRNA(Asn)/Glu-tRNA(Gln) amidotransferase subunit GatC [Acidobacteriaceae bacterium]|nr:Asp-tRNA(Asn)/Glu-tRNA(Gln) amidotransferase subunit GatC [Acidobacteriaceae bacterium]MBV9500840.1 Asp-tRNA(Asn)/Glu-tRNA(Gln) amidotransferase subunit GatC [Acidobacteriaceae bacterium]